MVSDELHVVRNMFDCIMLWTKVIARSQLSKNKDPKVIKEICCLLQEIQILEFEYAKSLELCKENEQNIQN